MAVSLVTRDTPRVREIGWFKRGIEATVARIKRHPDQFLCVTLATLVISFFFRLYYLSGKTIDYGDGITKLNNARRVFDNPFHRFSLAQLGTIWLPGMSALEGLTAWIDPLYRTGLSGSIWSMLAFLATALLLYETVLLMTGSRIAGIAAALVAITNLNVIYFGTTPMTEMLLMLVESLCCLSLIRLERAPQNEAALFLAALCLGASTLVRYETWFFVVVSAPIMAVSLARRGVTGWELINRLAVLFTIPVLLIVSWMVIWEWQIMHDTIYFSNSRYSARAIDVIGAHNTFAVRNLSMSVREYVLAVRANVPAVVLGAAVVGAVVYIARALARRATPIAAGYLLGVPLFFVVSVYAGQNAIAIRPGTLASLNIRYGTTVVPLVAVAVGCLVAVLARFRPRRVAWTGRAVAIAVAVVIVGAQLAEWRQPMHGTAVLADVAAQASPDAEVFAGWLGQHYDYGPILAESFGSINGVQFNAGIPLGRYVTETSPGLWRLALRHPETQVEWVLARPGDLVATTVVPTPAFQHNFVLVYRNEFGSIYVAVDHERNG